MRRVVLAGTIPPETIEEVRRRVEIVSLVGQHVALKKRGRNYLGLCPFHSEKTPSFTVSPDKQIFYCFGCGEGGDAISFLMKMNRLTFPEAVRELAARVGVVIPKPRLSQEGEPVTLGQQIRRLNELAAEFFCRSLKSPQGEGARSYLKARGIDEVTSETFRLGYAPEGWHHLHDFLLRKGAPLKVAEQAGLIVPRAGKEEGYYDRFRGRLMIPIEDVEGRVVAFGGRVLGPGEPKYLNSPESEVYSKGSILYGLSRSRRFIREQGVAVVVEGYFDLISLWGAGIRNVVATLGTALTRSHVELIRRFATQAVALFDPDEAGRKALSRSLELFLAAGVQGRAVILPEGEDPDTFVRNRGARAMEELLAGAMPMADYYIEHMIGQRGSLEEDRERLREAVAFLGRIENSAERNLFLKKVAEQLRVDEDVLKREVRLRLAPAGTAPQGVSLGRPAVDALELKLVKMMLEHPDRAGCVRDSGVLEAFRTDELKALAEAVLAKDWQGRSGGEVVELVESMSKGDLREELMGHLIQESPYPAELIERLMADCIRQLKKRALREKGKALTIRIKEAEKAKDGQLYDRLIAEKNRLLEEERALQGK